METITKLIAKLVGYLLLPLFYGVWWAWILFLATAIVVALSSLVIVGVAVYRLVRRLRGGHGSTGGPAA